MIDKDLMFNALLKYNGKLLIDSLIDNKEKALSIYAEVKSSVILYQRIDNWKDIINLLEPVESVKLLFSYYDFCFNIIHSLGGYIENIIGDEIIVIWDKNNDVASVQHACEVAKECYLQSKQIINKIDTRLDLEIVSGIHSGEIVVGNFGSSDRLFYRAIGDNIDTANKLMKLNSQYKTNVIISDKIINETHFEYRELDSIFIDNYKAIKIFELIE